MTSRKPDGPRVAPAASGLAWVMQSLELLRLQTSRLLFIAVLMQIVLGLVQVPLLGILVVLSIPGLSAGILEAFHVTGKGGRPPLHLLFLPLVQGIQRWRLYGLGMLVFAVGIASVSVFLGDTLAMVDEAALLRLQQGDLGVLNEIDPFFITRLFMAFGLSVAISGTITFFSIPLIWFRRRTLWPAVGEGIRALIVNWRPMLVLGGVLVVASLPITVLSGLLLQSAAAGGLAATISTALVMLLLLLFQLLLFGTQYCAFREIFGIATPQTPPPEQKDGQLVA